MRTAVEMRGGTVECLQVCYIHSDACAGVLHFEPWIIAHVSGRTQPPLRVMIGFWCVIRLAAITSAQPIRLVTHCAPSTALSSLCRLALLRG
jgi:hypothetical protein